MSIELSLSWTEFKAYIDLNLVSFKQLNRNNTYYLYLADGGISAICVLPQDGGSDQTDYETNYQSRANRRFSYYYTPINIRQTAATGAGATVFSMRNPTGSTRKVLIEEINLLMDFDSGTPLGRSLQRYGIQPFNTATPTGGSTQSAQASDNTDPTSQVTDIRFLDTGLTTTGVVFGNTVAMIGCPATDATVAPFVIKDPGFILVPGEGLCIRLGVAAVIGQGLTGLIKWSER